MTGDSLETSDQQKQPEQMTGESFRENLIKIKRLLMNNCLSLKNSVGVMDALCVVIKILLTRLFRFKGHRFTTRARIRFS